MLRGLGLLAVLVAGTCARTSSDETMWAEPAERHFVKMAEAFCCEASAVVRGMTARDEFLTGRAPLTTCTGSGGL